MTDISFTQLRAMFEACEDLSESERAAWLELNVTNPIQRAEMGLMLAADRQNQGFFRNDVVAHIDRLLDSVESENGEDSCTLAGKRFGPFELIRIIGRGGQGAVYLGRRVSSDFEQTVAVKLLRRGLHDPLELRRFRLERNILARFEHVGVARLIDGGVSDEGTPFLAMEYVDGVPIDEWCESHDLDQTSRVRLFSELCAVVAAAHRQLIVHRDLKPSNVLVTTNGDVKVLDFGIAKLLDEEEFETDVALRMITPGFGAPEQVNGGIITLSTDVFALGTLLRTILAGPGFGQHTDSSLKGLPQDLRWIIGKACSVEPELRYRDSAELNDDVIRFLEKRPVRAHPPSNWYRMRRFAVRHRGGIVITAMVVIGILTSLGLAVWQARVARAQLLRAEATRDFLIEVFDSAEEFMPKDARPTPDNLVRAAAARLETETKLDPISRADFLTTLAKISFSSNDYSQAIRHSDSAIQLLETHGQSDTRAQLAAEVIKANAQIRAGNAQSALQSLKPRLELIRAKSDEIAISGLGAYSSANIALGRFDEALAAVREGIDIAESTGTDLRTVLSMRTGHGYTLASAGRLAESVGVLDDALRRWKAANLKPDKTYSGLIATLAAVRAKLGQSDAAITLQEESLQLQRQIYVAPHEKIADALQNLAVMFSERGDFAQANMLIEESGQMYLALFGETHPQVLTSLTTQANFASKQGRVEEALATLSKVTAICDAHGLEKVHACPYSLRTQADLYLRLERHEQAAVSAQRGLGMYKELYGVSHPDYAAALTTWAVVQTKRNDPSAALATLEQAAFIYRTQKAERSLPMTNVLRSQAGALRQLNRVEAALAAIDEALTIANELAPKDLARRFTLLALRAEILVDLGRHEDAKTTARQALKIPITTANFSSQVQRLEAIAR